MSADGLARFDTRSRTRTAPTDEHSHQTDFRTIGAREHGQLALDELHTGNKATSENQTSVDTQTKEPTRADLEAALGCARTTIERLQERIAQLEAEREQVAEETKPKEDGGR
jgi:hypothetical protein